jgi:hypothetical protein
LYGKILFSEELDPERFIHKWTLLKVYNYHSFAPVPKKDYQKVITPDDFVYPLMMIGLPRTRGQKKWQVLGVEPTLENDRFVPVYSRYQPFLDKIETGEEKVPVVIDLEVNRYHYVPYNKGSHLPKWEQSDSEYIGWKLSMEYLRKNATKEEIKAFFEGEPEPEFWFSHAMNSTVQAVKYWEIPAEIRGIILP